MGLYSDKLWKACRLIKEYNAKLADMKLPPGVKAPKPINDEKFIEKLVKIGGVADELIRQCSWEELENCGLPRLLARDICKVFRANEVEPDDIVRHWTPLLKSWKLHWRDHIDLAEKLDAAARKHGWHKETEDHVEKLEAKKFRQLLEDIRDDHLAEINLNSLLAKLQEPAQETVDIWQPLLEQWGLALEECPELVWKLNDIAKQHGLKCKKGKLEVSNLVQGKEFLKLLEEARDEYLESGLGDLAI